MIHRVHRRIHAFLLAIVFVAGGIGLPGLDVAVYHRGAPSLEPTTRFQPAGAPLPHTLQCIVGHHTAGRALNPAFAAPVRPEPVIVLRREQGVPLVRSHQLPTLGQPRAPPAPSA